MLKTSYNNRGFTLVELMITVAISGIVIAAIYSAYISQQRTYLAQEQVAEMQQNIRAAIDMMTREIRMAGYDPTQSAGAGITTVTSSRFTFTQDINSDGNIPTVPPLGGETIIFGFSNANDIDNNGVADAGAAPLGRETGGGFQPIAENIQAIEFRYLDATGAVTAVLADIRSVQVSILARAGREDRDFTNTMVYCPASNPFNPATGLCTNAAPATIWGPYNDNFRRRLLITTIQCRN
jgi:type IV pilus assembly protein PilW